MTFSASKSRCDKERKQTKLDVRVSVEKRKKNQDPGLDAAGVGGFVAAAVARLWDVSLDTVLGWVKLGTELGISVFPL